MPAAKSSPAVWNVPFAPSVIKPVRSFSRSSVKSRKGLRTSCVWLSVKTHEHLWVCFSFWIYIDWPRLRIWRLREFGNRNKRNAEFKHLLLIVNHINSAPRECIGNETPYNAALETMGEDVLNAFQLRPIDLDEVNLTPKLSRFNH